MAQRHQRVDHVPEPRVLEVNHRDVIRRQVPSSRGRERRAFVARDDVRHASLVDERFSTAVQNGLSTESERRKIA